MYETILLATDGSDCAQTATEHAISQATAHDATIHALSVIETRTEYDGGIVDPEKLEREQRKRAESILEDVESMARARTLEVVTSIRRGIPDREIVGYVDEHGVDLVVVGTRGRSELKRVLLGSTSEALVRELSVPIVLIPAGGDDGSGKLE